MRSPNCLILLVQKNCPLKDAFETTKISRSEPNLCILQGSVDWYELSKLLVLCLRLPQERQTLNAMGGWSLSRTGSGEKLSSSQAEPVQAIK